MKPDPKTFLFVGEDSFKQEKIEEILAKFLNPANRDFNYDLFYAKDLKKEHFKDLVSRFPAAASFRVLRIKEIDSLPPNAKERIISCLNKPLKSLVLILESSKEELGKNDFLKKISSKVDFFHVAKKDRQINVFDLCKAMIDKNTALALKLLKELEVDQSNAPQVMGGIIWQWEQLKYILSTQDLEENFKVLHEVDRRIKTGRLKPDLAIEMLVLSLSSGKRSQLFF